MESWNRRHSWYSRHDHLPFTVSEPLAFVVDLIYGVRLATIAQRLTCSRSTDHFAHPAQRLYWHTASSSAIFATVWCSYDDRIHYHNVISIPSSGQGAAEAIKEILSFFANGPVLLTRDFFQPSNSGIGSGTKCS